MKGVSKWDSFLFWVNPKKESEKRDTRSGGRGDEMREAVVVVMNLNELEN